ncbi:hypothetical protein BS78_09G014600 [Paspalum vaginatum]|nr:hypothetical protein BS78_09G014600 [Paspalum vaginatum]
MCGCKLKLSKRQERLYIQGFSERDGARGCGQSGTATCAADGVQDDACCGSWPGVLELNPAGWMGVGRSHCRRRFPCLQKAKANLPNFHRGARIACQQLLRPWIGAARRIPFDRGRYLWRHYFILALSIYLSSICVAIMVLV